MTTEIKNHIILVLLTRKIKQTFVEPNSKKSTAVAKNYAALTGIGWMEIHRFHNAVINNNLENSFKADRIELIARILIKMAMRSEKIMPNENLRGQMSRLANDLGVSFNDMLEVARELYKEIIDETLKPQSQL